MRVGSPVRVRKNVRTLLSRSCLSSFRPRSSSSTLFVSLSTVVVYVVQVSCIHFVDNGSFPDRFSLCSFLSFQGVCMGVRLFVFPMVPFPFCFDPHSFLSVGHTCFVSCSMCGCVCKCVRMSVTLFFSTYTLRFGVHGCMHVYLVLLFPIGPFPSISDRDIYRYDRYTCNRTYSTFYFVKKRI